MHETGQTTLNPYLTFDGNCREAMEFYKEALNAELELLPFEGNPVEVPEDYKQKVMHSTLKFEGAVVMASDAMPGQKISHGNGISLSIASSNVKEARKMFTNLSVEGHVIMPFEKTFWGAEFGIITDKFGISWMVNCEEVR